MRNSLRCKIKHLQNILSRLGVTNFVLLLFVFGVFGFFVYLCSLVSTPIGGDWNFPHTGDQIKSFTNIGYFTWQESLLGNRISIQNVFYASLLVKFFITLFGLQWGLSLFVFSTFFSMCFGMYYLLRYYDIKKEIALIAAITYLLTPITYNYFLMGWVYVLLAMSLFPWILYFFSKAFKTNSLAALFISAIMFGVSFAQSQSVIWVNILILLSVLLHVRSFRLMWKFIGMYVLFNGVFLLMHVSWWPSLLIFPDVALLGNDLVQTSASIGTSLRLNFVNLLRMWGSLYNYQFETAYLNSFLPEFFSYIPVLILLISLVITRKRKILVFYCIVLYLITPTLYLIPREAIKSIPFSNLIRDFSRFSVLSAFSYAILFGIFLEALNQKIKQSYVLLIGVLVCVLTAFPFINGSMFGNSYDTSDFRYRGLSYPSDFYKAEKIVNKETLNTKALFLPFGFFGYVDQKGFVGSYQEVQDIWSGYSRVPSTLYFSDRGFGFSTDIAAKYNELLTTYETSDLLKLSRYSSVNTFVVRNFTWPQFSSIQRVNTNLKENSTLVKSYESSKISVYNTDQGLPHFYIPQTHIISNNINSLIDGDVIFQSSSNGERYMHTIQAKGINKDLLVLSETNIFPNAFSLYYPKPHTQYISPETLLWNKGWAWPYASISPDDWKYQLVRDKEVVQYLVTKNPVEYVNNLVWLMSKRFEELSQYDLKPETRNLLIKDIDKYSKDITAFLESYPIKERDDRYWGLVKKVYMYLEAGVDKVSTTSSDPKISDFFRDFTVWVDSNAGLSCEGYCFEYTSPESGEFDILVKIPDTDYLSSNSSADISLINYLDAKKVDFLVSSIKPNSWERYGTYNFTENETYRLNLTIPDVPNLAASAKWQNLNQEIDKDGSINIYIQRLFEDSSNNARYIDISNMESNAEYMLELDYSTSNSNIDLFLMEEIPDFKTIYGNEKYDWENYDLASVPSTRVISYNQLLREKTLNISSEKTEEENSEEYKNDKYCNYVENEDCFVRFKSTINTSLDKRGAWLFIAASGDVQSFGEIKIRNLSIKKVIKPEVALVKRNRTVSMPKSTENITFKKVNPTKYVVDVTKATKPFWLVFNESFSTEWRLYEDTYKNLPVQKSYYSGEINESYHSTGTLDPKFLETLGKKELSKDTHYLVNGYANAWYIDPKDFSGKEDISIIVEFLPQRWFYLGLMVSATVLTFIFVYIGVGLYKHVKRTLPKISK